MKLEKITLGFALAFALIGCSRIIYPTINLNFNKLMNKETRLDELKSMRDSLLKYDLDLVYFNYNVKQDTLIKQDTVPK